MKKYKLRGTNKVYLAKNKQSLLRRIRKETPVFAKGKTTSDFTDAKEEARLKEWYNEKIRKEMKLMKR